MILSLQTYFDIGVSYGLGDNIFSNAPGTLVPDIPGIGLRNPLGLGLVRRLEGVNDELLEQWRTGAAAKVNVPEMELGFEYATKDPALATLTFDEFKDRLRRCIHEHMPTCEFTIYAVGTVFLRLDFPATMPLPFLRGFGRCFEYAAYEVPIATALLRVARTTIEERLGRKDSALQTLSKRPDPDEQADESGNTESRLITSFTYVAMCVDKSDDVGAVKYALLPQQRAYDELEFEYHGKLYFNWAACVLEPRRYDDADESPIEQIQRMLWCIKIAHSFLGTCEAFENLFFSETQEQVEHHISGKPGGRDSRELNRLRTLALAVVSTTRYEQVAVAEEDQRYFAHWEQHAKLRERHEIVQERCEVLHNVQDAERQDEETQRERLLSITVLFLTAFTFVSVFADSYAFVHEKDDWIPNVLHRAVVLGGMLALLIAGVLMFVRYLLVGRGGRRRRRGRH